MSKSNFKNMSLSNRIALFVSLLLGVVFLIFILVSGAMSTAAIKSSTYSQLNNLARKNALQIEYVFEQSKLVTGSIAEYVAEADLEGSGQNTSRIYPEYKLSDGNITAENYILNHAITTLTSNAEIAAVGAAFESNKFVKGEESYSFYANMQSGSLELTDLGDITVYSNNSIYQEVKETKKLSITEPYIENGMYLVTVAQPIMKQDEFIGIVLADIILDHFDRINTDNEDFKSLYSELISDEGIIAYHTLDSDTIGKEFKENFRSSSQYESFENMRAQGEPFQMEFKAADGGTFQQFAYPIIIEGTVWYAVTAVSQMDVMSATIISYVLLVILAVVILIIIIAAIIHFIRSQLKPINDVTMVATSVSKGNLDVEINVNSRNEIGDLARSFGATIAFLKNIISDVSAVLNQIADNNLNTETNVEYVGDFQPLKSSIDQILKNLNQVMAEVAGGANRISTGSKHLADASQSLAEGAIEQVSAIEQLRALTNEVNDQAERSAKTAGELSKKVELVGQEVAKSNEEMAGMVNAMNGIAESSKQIEMIIKTIEDIVSQTQLLSLNASIEAARAGDAGRGFTNVAEEIQKLAKESGEAADGSKSLITNSNHAVANGSELAMSMRESLKQLSDGIYQVVGIMESISEAAAMQSESIHEVSRSIEEISEAVDSNSAASEESAATSEELYAQAQSYMEISSRFTLKDNKS